MKLRARLIVLSLIATMVFSFVGLQGVSAQSDLSEEQLKRISSNCLSIKNSLNQLHASDALLRVNRGQLYDSIGSKLMNNFNSRLSSNNLDNKGLQATTNGYQTALTTFRNDYQLYERQLTATIRIDCDKSPAEFHNAIEDARVKRAKVHTDVLRLNLYIDDYRTGVNDFLINFERIAD